jgi:hypothetical protein
MINPIKLAILLGGLIWLIGFSVTVGICTAGDYNPAPASNTSIVNNTSIKPVGVALAAASGTCVKDWKPGWQKCVSWAMLDIDTDDDDDTVHAFGGGITTRVDQFAVHFYGGFENFGTDEEAILFTGSLNWR